jgi:phosphatidylserine decarboxylase
MTKKEVLQGILLTNAKIHADGSSSSLEEVLRLQKQVKS